MISHSFCIWNQASFDTSAMEEIAVEQEQMNFNFFLFLMQIVPSLLQEDFGGILCYSQRQKVSRDSQGYIGIGF